MTWESLAQYMPTMRVAWMGGPGIGFEADHMTFEVRLAGGKHVMLVIPDHSARKLLRTLHRALPDEPLPPPPD
jgi:hypothetical protein